MTLLSIIGYLAWVLTTGALIPQVYRTLKLRSAYELSFLTLLFLALGNLLWFVFGYYIHDIYLLTGNALNAALSGILLVVKIQGMRKK